MKGRWPLRESREAVRGAGGCFPVPREAEGHEAMLHLQLDLRLLSLRTVLGFSAGWDFPLLRACVPGPPSSPQGVTAATQKARAVPAAPCCCPRLSPAAQLCPPSYLRGVF